LSVTENDELPAPRRPRRRDDDLPPRNPRPQSGRVQVYVQLHGLGCRQVFADDNRDTAVAWARKNIREGGSVERIELKDGKTVELLWARPKEVGW
jgi:hypothetical protein